MINEVFMRCKKSIASSAIGILCLIILFWKFDADPIRDWMPISIITIISMVFGYLAFFVAEWLISKNILQAPTSTTQKKSLIAFIFFAGVSIILLFYESYGRFNWESSTGFFAFTWLSIITMALAFTPLIRWIENKEIA